MMLNSVSVEKTIGKSKRVFLRLMWRYTGSPPSNELVAALPKRKEPSRLRESVDTSIQPAFDEVRSRSKRAYSVWANWPLGSSARSGAVTGGRVTKETPLSVT